MLCLVTDRHRRSVVEQARDAAQAGVDLIQVRERDLEGAALSALVAEPRARPAPRRRVVVNERLDVACMRGGRRICAAIQSRLLVRGDSARRFLIGRSVHGADEAIRAAPGADYLIAGTVPTPSKPGRHECLGITAGLD
jgi:thiazole tautomerase (transcriptional regulator TenI)